MAQQIINVGNVANDGQGDPLRTAFQKTNENFTELYDLGGLTGIQNGTSNIQIIEDGAITMAVGGVANTFVVTTVGATTLGTSSANAVSAVGDITASGFFYGNGRQLTGVLAVTDANSLVGTTLNSNVVNSSLTSVGILTSMYSSGNVTGGNIIALANVQAGNLKTTGIISATGNVTGGYFLGNGSQLTGISNINMGTSNVTVDISTGNIIVGVNGTPNVAVFYNNGVSATGNITGNYFLGNGSQLTGISNINMGTSNVTVDNSTGNIVVGVNGTPNVAVFYNNGVSTSGNITAPYFLGNGSQLTGVTGVGTLTSLSVIGNTVTGNLNTGGLVSAAGNITGANLISGGLITAVGNITGANLISGGLITAVGNITGANINGDTVRSPLGFFSDTMTAGNILLTNFLVTNGNVAAGNVSGTTLAGNLTTASQPNVTSVGILTSLSVSGTVTTNNINSVGDLNLSTTGNVVLSSKNINGLSDPVQNQDAATKYYVDNIATTGITYHDAVLAATTGTLDSASGGTVSYAEPNGAGNGIGAKLTTTGTFDLIDTANIQTIGARVLVKNEANAAWNGVYTYSNTTAIVRSIDADEYGANASQQLSVNDYFFVSSGNVNLGSAWIVSSPVGAITFGTSNILFSQFSGSQVYTANSSAGLSLVGQTFNAKVDNTTTAFDGGGNIVVKTSAALTTPNIGAATGTSLSTTGNITGANINGSGAGLTNVTAVAVGTLTSLSVTGNIQGGNLRTVGLVSATGNVSGNNISSTNSIFSTVDLRAGGIVSSAGNILTGTGISAVGNIATAANISGSYFSGNGSQLTGIVATSIGTLASLSVTGNTVTGNLQSLGAITGVAITGTSLSVSTGNISGGNINNNNANGVGNIGSSTVYFNTVFAKATSAEYADLAEKYTSDAGYPPGTVLSFGGPAEVTQSTTDADRRIIGIVSTRPSYIMNAGIESEYTVDVALQGRVPCLVQGTVARGDMMVSAGNGRARAEHNPTFGTVIGKALEDFAGEFGTIEVVVGRL